MSFYLPPWQTGQEPNQSNVRQYLDALFMRVSPREQPRWNQANIDTLFYAGSQDTINRNFGFRGADGRQDWHFNLCQQPVNMVTGYQRQHRKSINYIPSEGADPHTTDQYTRLITHVNNVEGINEAFSRGCELSAVSGMVLAQPYLDYTGDDPAQGQMKLKIWEYNSFLTDGFARQPDFSDASVIWTQEYITSREARERFSDQEIRATPMRQSPSKYGNFYFLPENYNMDRSDLMVVSYLWYKWKRKKKRLYSQQRNQFFDFGGGQEQLDQILYNIPDLQVVEVDTPTWKLAVILNDQLMFQGENPLGFDECPMVPIFWNWDGHIADPNLYVRSLIRTMRSSQFLMNRQIIISHEQKETTINSGWMRTIDAVANEDNLKKGLNGWDIILNEGKVIGQDIQRIEPTQVPQSDFALAERLSGLIYSTSGINLENWSAQEDPKASTLTTLIKQAANLVVLQKYFDQWDYSLKLLGHLQMMIALNNWNASKVGLILGEEPTPHFYSRIFAKYQVIVEEGLNTATQKNMQAQNMMDINQIFGREVFPPSMVIKDMNFSGKAEAMEFLQGQEQQAQAAQQEAQGIAHAFEEAKLKELYSKAVSNIATARERHGRAESNIGLFEERLSMIGRNNSMSAKAKAEALEKLVEVTQKYGELEAHLKMNELQSIEHQEENKEDLAKLDAKRTSMANDFVAQMLAGMGGQQGNQQEAM